MKFSEAIEELKQGKNIKRKPWTYSYLKMDEEKHIIAMREEFTNYIYDTSIVLSNEWIKVGDETKKLISFGEALDVLAAGGKVKYHIWDENTYITILSDNLILRSYMEFHNYNINWDDMKAMDWEICT